MEGVEGSLDCHENQGSGIRTMEDALGDLAGMTHHTRLGPGIPVVHMAQALLSSPSSSEVPPPWSGVRS